MRSVLLVFFIMVVFYGFSGCSIVPPKINLTGEKTVIEKQIVGDYRELEEDAWVISSVKTTVSKSRGAVSAAGGDRELFLAMKVREFHRDKIRAYKSDGAIGETSRGYIKYRVVVKYDRFKVQKDILFSVIKNENDARRTIFIKILIKNGTKEPSEKEIDTFGRIFAGEQREIAQKNDWLQEESGRWVRK